ncbi:hypothetical protein VMCG_10091 [Cytospora schulzeri]|uniref:Uncharacterized protein n=1 Tax=Cytospora schulzeri TaxID=448051 RepID=A0A423VGB8_9PEZI|nr:hypothetical protein VMCG_10091 [Valsa malicola]
MQRNEMASSNPPRETGSAFSPNIIIEASNVTRLPPAAPAAPAYPGAPEVFPAAAPSLHDGQDDGSELVETLIPSESGDGQTIVRCPKCLTVMWGEYGVPLVKYIKGGTLDRAWLVEPDAHIFVRSKRPFVEIGDGKPQFERYYERTTSQAAALSGASNIAAQIIETYQAQRPFSFDLLQLARFMILTVITAPPNYHWQLFLEKNLPAYVGVDDGRDLEKRGIGQDSLADEARSKPKLSLRNTLTKWVVDCLTLGAIVNVVAFFILMGLLKGQSLEIIGQNIRTVSPAGDLGW